MAVRYGAAWLVCALALSLVGCASPLTTARKSVSAAATIGAAAGDIADSYDEQRQGAVAAQLAKDHNLVAAEQARDDWRAARTHALQALKTYNAVVTAAGATAELAGDKSLDLPALVDSLTQAYTSLKGALASYGVTLPGGL